MKWFVAWLVGAIVVIPILVSIVQLLVHWSTSTSTMVMAILAVAVYPAILWLVHAVSKLRKGHPG
jgi:hypothetical protein